MAENSGIVKGKRDPRLFVYGADICDLPGLKRYIWQNSRESML